MVGDRADRKSGANYRRAGSCRYPGYHYAGLDCCFSPLMQSSGSQLPGPGQGSAAGRASRGEHSASSDRRQGLLQAHKCTFFFFAEGSGSWCALPWLDNVPLDTCTAVEASDECEARTQQKGLSLNAHTAEGFSCRNLGWCLELEWPHRPGMAANTDPGPQRGPGLWGVNGGLGQLASVNVWIPVGQKPWNLQGVGGSSAGPRFPVGKTVCRWGHWEL